jgi:hypothetical protein
MTASSGYLHPAYVDSLAEFGTPRSLPRCGGWILECDIPGAAHRDGRGCYPLFFCRDWSQLAADLADIGDGLVSVSLVTDPFGAFEPAELERSFDVVRPFKEHVVIDCSRPIDAVVSKNHRYQARKALKHVAVEVCADPLSFLDEWVALYDVLVRRHHLRGIQAFSKTAFARQLAIPGAMVLRASHDGVTVGGLLSFQQGDLAYAHLVASSELGYGIGATYALFWSAIEHLSGKVRWFSIGGSPGVSAAGGSGLDFFKRGWSRETRTVYFCGRISHPRRYEEIVRARGGPPTSYFPAYRHGEFE